MSLEIGTSPYAGPKEIHYLFVDGASLFGCLKNLSKKYFGDVRFDVDFHSLAAPFTKVFYYDAVPVRDVGEAEDAYETRIEPIKRVFEAAASVDRVHVYEGDARRRPRRGLEQRKVDVMLTVDMLTHAFHRNMHQATLLTGDGDFKPLIDALVQVGMFITLLHPLGETNRELLQSADARQPLILTRLSTLLTPQSRESFRLPLAEHRHPTALPGEWLTAGQDKNQKFRIHKDGDAYVVIREDTPHYLCLRHQNFDLLRRFCRESHGLTLPELSDFAAK